MRPVVLWSAAALLAIGGCRSADPPGYWPPAQLLTQRGADEYRGYDLNDDGRLDYLQRQRGGVVDRLYFLDRRGAADRVVDRPALARGGPLLILMLDGVSYEHIANLRRRGHFRLFHEPSVVISTFPSLTDVAYDDFFRTGPTPGYEAGYFDAPRNELTDGAAVYLAGTNEHWVRYADYRINVWRDAFMYLRPRETFQSELEQARATLDRLLVRGRRDVVIYMLSTDGLGHMLKPDQIEAELVRLDGWIERLLYDWGGALHIAMLADHGNSMAPQRAFDIRAVLRSVGLRPVDRLERPGDVAVPLFGLLDVARVHTFDSETTQRVLAALRGRPEIELLASRDGAAVRVESADGAARIERREDGAVARYAYQIETGDPLRAASAYDRFDGAELAGAPSADGASRPGFVSADAWLRATWDNDYPAGVPRLWDGMMRLCDERPDVVASLSEGWFVGSGFLAAFVNMNGTHGSLHRRGSTTFAMCTSCELPSPLTVRDVFATLEALYDWQPAARE